MELLHNLLLDNIGTVLTVVVTGFGILLLVWLKKYFVTWKAYDERNADFEQRHSEHETRLTAHGERIAAMEGTLTAINASLENLPRREDILKIEGSLREISATLEGLKALEGRLEGQVNMVTKHLLEK
jgi:hypothetical protein